jgi:hypothetical protein
MLLRGNTFVLTNRHSVAHEKCGKMSRPHFWVSSVAREPSNTSSSYISSHAGRRRSSTPAPRLGRSQFAENRPLQRRLPQLWSTAWNAHIVRGNHLASNDSLGRAMMSDRHRLPINCTPTSYFHASFYGQHLFRTACHWFCSRGGCAAVTTALKRYDCGEMGRCTERSATIKSQCKGLTRSALFWHRLRWSIDEHEQRAHRVLLGYPRNNVMINERRVPTLLGILVRSEQDTASICLWSVQAIDQEVFHRSMVSLL